MSNKKVYDESMSETISTQTLHPPKGSPPSPAHDDYGMLMSLALDGQLEDEETAKLQVHLKHCPPCAQQWQLWQTIDTRFRAAPLVAPPVDFVARVEKRVHQQERRRHFRVGVLLSLLTFVLWAAGLIGTAIVLGFLVYNQVEWLTNLLHWATLAWSAVSIFGQSLWQVAANLVDNPATIGIMIGYLVLAMLILGSWTRFLQRSTHLFDAQS